MFINLFMSASVAHNKVYRYF